jgi:uncharacterized protein YneF (UPF0154 family)
MQELSLTMNIWIGALALAAGWVIGIWMAGKERDK